MKPQPFHAQVIDGKLEDEGKLYEPPFAKGGKIWVKETFSKTTSTKSKGCVLYRSDMAAREMLCDNGGIGDPVGLGSDCKPLYASDDAIQHWKPSIFMPRWASRITLEVLNVRVERLQDISEADALAEGITWPDRNGKPYRPPIDTTGMSDLNLAKERYSELWGSINGKGSWALNPYVWCYEFRRIKP